MFTLVGLRKNIFVFHSSSETKPSSPREIPTKKPEEKTQMIPTDFPKAEFFRVFDVWKNILPTDKGAKATKFNELLTLCKNSGMNIHPYLNTPDKMNAFAELLRNTETTKRITEKNLANTYPKKLLTKEELQVQIKAIKEYDIPKLTSEIQKYQNARFNQKFADNSFEIIALYQATLNRLDTISRQDVDGQFGDATLMAIRAFQTKNSIYPIDGFPGPKTTQALIKELERKESSMAPPMTVSVVTPTPSVPPTSSLEIQPPTSIFDMVGKYLEDKGYSRIAGLQNEIRYRSPDGDLTIRIASDGTVEPIRGLSRIFGKWGYSGEEKLIVTELIKKISDFKKTK